jgi:hyperosmotically inducible protein
MKLLQLGTVLLFATFAAAQQEAQPPYAPPPHETPPPPVTGERTPGQMPPDTKAPATPAVTNSDVQQQIQKKISEEPGLAGANVSVSVDDRSVVLTGTVDSQEQHDLALKMAQSVAGDRPIDDKLQIRAKA